jgi:hypothetical protein
MEEARAEMERLVARAKANTAEADAIQAEFDAVIDRLMSGGPDERELARQVLANAVAGADVGIAEAQHIRDFARNRFDDGLI